jgi:hypothetical protein
MPLLLRRPSANRPASTFTLQDILASGFVVLAEEPDREIVLGLVGRFWTLGGGIRRISPSEFAGLAEPGYAKAAWNFYLVPQTGGTTHLVTETRVLCTDEASRRAFLRYWRLIGPFSGLIRRQMLATVRKEAERDRRR